MGCNSSKENTLANVDDSVHVMIAHDKKRAAQKGEQPHGYVPRAPHPLLDKAKEEQQQQDDGETKESEDAKPAATAAEG